jgi:hypothetical protein
MHSVYTTHKIKVNWLVTMRTYVHTLIWGTSYRVQEDKLERGLHAAATAVPSSSSNQGSIELCVQAFEGVKLPSPLLRLLFYIDKSHISINCSYNNSLSHSLVHFLTNIRRSMGGREVRLSAESLTEVSVTRSLYKWKNYFPVCLYSCQIQTLLKAGHYYFIYFFICVLQSRLAYLICVVWIDCLK